MRLRKAMAAWSSVAPESSMTGRGLEEVPGRLALCAFMSERVRRFQQREVPWSYINRNLQHLQNPKGRFAASSHPHEYIESKNRSLRLKNCFISPSIYTTSQLLYFLAPFLCFPSGTRSMRKTAARGTKFGKYYDIFWWGYDKNPGMCPHMIDIHFVIIVTLMPL